MTITICPKCGSMNITTAGTCANCGWSQFAQVTVSSGVYETVGELEIKMSGKALLDDYKRLLFENNKLTARIAELEEFKMIVEGCGFEVITEPPVLKHPERKTLKGHGTIYVPELPEPPEVQE